LIFYQLTLIDPIRFLFERDYLEKIKITFKKEIRDYPIRGEISFSNLVEDGSS